MTTSLVRLSDVPVRDVWPDEATDFTPWLAENIDHLSDAAGLELEPSGTEAQVERFSADIVATDSRSGSRVLIENRLENSDHRHLGQIMTYLAGLQARFVIWLARDFEEAHRSAIRWLNDHTDADFGFFAVRVRVVRISDSPCAPVFEVLEMPNSWEKALDSKVKRAESERTKLREAFWNRYLERRPGLFNPKKSSNVWLKMIQDGPVILSMYVGSEDSGMYLRGRSGADGKELDSFLEGNSEALERELGTSHWKKRRQYSICRKDITIYDKESWGELIDWMEDRRCRYKRTLDALG